MNAPNFNVNWLAYSLFTALSQSPLIYTPLQISKSEDEFHYGGEKTDKQIESEVRWSAKRRNNPMDCLLSNSSDEEDNRDGKVCSRN